MKAPAARVPGGTFPGAFGTLPADLPCSRWYKSRGLWNACPQPRLKKKCEPKGGISGGCSPAGPPSGSAAKHLRKYGIHVHPSGIQKANRSSVKAPIWPRTTPSLSPRVRSTKFPFSNFEWNQPVPKSACNAVSEFPFVCLLHAAQWTKVPFLQLVRFPVHGYDIPFEPGAGRQAVQMGNRPHHQIAC